MPPIAKLSSKIAVIGVGNVGAAIAYCLVMNSIAGEVIVVDANQRLQEAQASDLFDASAHGANTLTQVRAGTPQEAAQCDIIVLTAGSNHQPGESRLDLIGRNLKILRSVLTGMGPIRQDAILLCVSNPVDVITYFARELSGLPKNQVFGSGTSLDSARLRGLVADAAEVAASSINAYVLGEHGDSQMVAWSAATVGGVPLDLAVEEGQIPKEQIADAVKNRANAIIKLKGETSFGIGAVAANICRSILYDQHCVMPLSHYHESFDACFSIPAIVGREGIVRTVELPLSDEEHLAVEASAERLRDVISQAKQGEPTLLAQAHL